MYLHGLPRYNIRRPFIIAKEVENISIHEDNNQRGRFILAVYSQNETSPLVLTSILLIIATFL
jgi:hypothetical protein